MHSLKDLAQKAKRGDYASQHQQSEDHVLLCNRDLPYLRIRECKLRTDAPDFPVLNSYAFLPHVDLVGRIQPVLFVGWTLGYIMLFYLLFSISLWAKESMQVPLTIFMMIAIIIAAQWLPDATYRTFYGDPILMEFAMGCLIGLLLRQPSVIDFIKRTPMWPFMLVGATGLGVALYLDYTGWGKIATYAPSAALLVFGCAGQDLYRTPLHHGLLATGGKISYGIFIAMFTIFGDGLVGTGLLFVSTLTVTTILAYCSWRYFEVPANKWLRRKLRLSNHAPRSAPAETKVRQTVV